MIRELVTLAARSALDFAQPLRCAGCGTIVGERQSFCAECWKSVDCLGHSGCTTCDLPLQVTESATCGACLAPSRLARTRPQHRGKTVSGSFRVRNRNALAGKTVLVGGVLTTGSTAEACARTLARAGTALVELISWAPVVKPSQLMR